MQLTHKKRNSMVPYFIYQGGRKEASCTLVPIKKICVTERFLPGKLHIVEHSVLDWCLPALQKSKMVIQICGRAITHELNCISGL